MTDAGRNLEEVPQGQTHTLDITFLNSPNGSPVHPDGFDPGNPSDVSAVTATIKIYDVSLQTYSTPPGGYNAPTTADLRYGGTKGKFLVDVTSLVNSKLTDNLVGEYWAIEWVTTIGGIVTSAPGTAEFFKVTDGTGASFGANGYASVRCVREELVQGLKKDKFVIAASGPAVVGSIRLPDTKTEAITKVIVNGVESGDYTYDSLDTLTFSPALSLDDIVVIERDTIVTDDRIAKDSVVVSHIINGILGGRYSTPFDVDCVPTMVSDAACAMTAMRIRGRLFGSTGDKHGDPHADNEWQMWMDLLTAVKNGEIPLICPDGTKAEVANRGIRHNMTNKKQVFNMDQDPFDVASPPRDIDYPVDFTDRH